MVVAGEAGSRIENGAGVLGLDGTNRDSRNKVERAGGCVEEERMNKSEGEHHRDLLDRYTVFAI